MFHQFYRYSNMEKMKFTKAFQKISEIYDYVILDLGAGITRTTLDFALLADFSLIVTTPDDIQTGYGCAKAAAERLKELENRYKKKNPDYHNYDIFSPLFIFNKSDRESAMGIFTGVLRASVITQKKSGIIFRPRYLGYIQENQKAITKAYSLLNKPVSEIALNSIMGIEFQTIAQYFLDNKILNRKKIKETPLHKLLRFFRNEETIVISTNPTISP